MYKFWKEPYLWPEEKTREGLVPRNGSWGSWIGLIKSESREREELEREKNWNQRHFSTHPFCREHKALSEDLQVQSRDLKEKEAILQAEIKMGKKLHLQQQIWHTHMHTHIYAYIHKRERTIKLCVCVGARWPPKDFNLQTILLFI